MAKKSSSSNLLFWIIGLCAFLSFMCTGIAWSLGKIGLTLPGLAQIKSIATLVLMVSAFVAGLVWLNIININKTFKLVLRILFIVFALLSILGLYF